MQKLNQSYIKFVVKKALEEDLRPRGDLTTNLINSKNKMILAKIIAKQDGVIAGFCLLYTSPSPRDVEESRMPSSA